VYAVDAADVSLVYGTNAWDGETPYNIDGPCRPWLTQNLG